MLHITVPAAEFYDEKKEEFYNTPETVLVMEHSLISISKWEAKWKKSYISSDDKTPEEIIDYLRCMTIQPKNVDPMVYRALSKESIDEIIAYIDDPMTATVINEVDKKGASRKKPIITSEIIYYDMIVNNIPTEYEKWHLNRLLTLIRVCIIKNNPKKMSRQDAAAHNRALNAARRKKYGTKG